MKYKYIVYLFLVLILSGCGYKPTSYYAKNEIKGNIYIDATIDIKNSENSVLMRDAINELILSKFEANIVPLKAKADMIIIAKLKSVSHKGLQTSSNGYANLYRATVIINVKYKKNKKDSAYISLDVTNYYDYSVDTDSTVTAQKKLDAVKIASSKALTDLFSKIAVNRFRK